MKMKIKTIDDYIASQPADKREMLSQLRAIIKSVATGATEGISYKVPTFTQNGHLVGFGTNKNGCSLYCMNANIAGQLPEAFKKLSWSASTIHFAVGQKLPVATIKKIVRYRIRENEERKLKKEKKTIKK